MESKYRLFSRAPRQRFIFPIVSTLLLLTATFLVALPAAGDGVMLRDGVLVDTARGTAFVMSTEGGLDALDLELGQVQWRSDDAVKPLMLADGRLLAQAEPRIDGALRVVALDAKSSKLVHQAAIALPEGVRGAIDDSPFTTFRTHARRDGDDAMIAWSKTSTNGTGAVLPGPGENMAPAVGTASVVDMPVNKGFERAEGAARMSWDTGAAVAVAPGAFVQAKAGVASGGLRELPVAERLDLPGRQFASIDGLHVLASERLKDTRDVWGQYRWTVALRETGAVVGTINHHRGVAPFVVVDGRLVYASEPMMARRGKEMVQEPLQLRAIDLSSGVQVWAHKVRNTDFAGPFAP